MPCYNDGSLYKLENTGGVARVIEDWARNLKLNPDSLTTQQLYEHRHLTVGEYVSKFRKGRIIRVFPSEALTMLVEEVLRKKIVGGVNLRKLLESNREKFRK